MLPKRSTSLLVLLLAVSVHGYPKGHHKLQPHDKTPSDDPTAPAGNSLEVIPSADATPTIPKDKTEGAPDVPGVSGDGDSAGQAKTEESPGGSEVTPAPPVEEKKKCPGVVCSPPPFVQGAQCRVTTTQQINPVIPLLGSKGDCCPVHVCVRPDGSQFTHYGIQSESFSETRFGPQPPSPVLLMGPPPVAYPQGPAAQGSFYQQQQQQQGPPPNFLPGGPYNRPQQSQQFPQPPPFNFGPYFGPGNPSSGPFHPNGGGPFNPHNRLNRSPNQNGPFFGGPPQLTPTWDMQGGLVPRDRRELPFPPQQAIYGAAPYGFRA